MTRAKRQALILYGPPAVGKSTITRFLEKSDHRFRLFPRLKAGSGRIDEYRQATTEELSSLSDRGDLVWQNARYGAVYAIDRPYLRQMVADGQIPVLHAGQLAAVDAIVAALPDVRVTRISLICPRDIAAERINARATGDSEERLSAYDATEPYPDADMSLDTSSISPGDAADLIAQRIFS